MIDIFDLEKQQLQQKILRVVLYRKKDNYCWRLLFYMYRLSRDKELVITHEVLEKAIAHDGITTVSLNSIRDAMRTLTELGFVSKTKINRRGDSIIYFTSFHLTPLGEEIGSNLYNIVKCVSEVENNG